MVDDKGRRVKEAGPSTPVEILGLSDVPNAGEILIAHENDKTAKQFAETFVAQNKVKKLEETKSKMSLDDLFTKIQEGNLKELNLIIKADVQGSVEAVKQSLMKLSNEEVVVKSYLFMVAALLITAFAAFTVSPYAAIKMLTGYNFYLLMFGELGIVFASNWAISKNNAVLAGILYTIYAYLTGVLLSVICMIYTGSSLVKVFLLTAGMFLIMAVYGLVTKKDLTKMGNILIMALWGLILATVFNMFIFRGSMVDFALSIVGVLIFTGLTAYDSQKIKENVYMANDSNVLCLSLMGAFELYLDFVNLFLKLVRLFGKKK